MKLIVRPKPEKGLRSVDSVIVFPSREIAEAAKDEVLASDAVKSAWVEAD